MQKDAGQLIFRTRGHIFKAKKASMPKACAYATVAFSSVGAYVQSWRLAFEKTALWLLKQNCSVTGKV
jgi:hypothetical protein